MQLGGVPLLGRLSNNLNVPYISSVLYSLFIMGIYAIFLKTRSCKSDMLTIVNTNARMLKNGMYSFINLHNFES